MRAMNEERRQVLEMVAAGTVSAEQGDELLAALEGPTRSMPMPRVQVRTRREERASRSNGELDSVVDRLSAAARYGITSEFIEELRELGYTNLTLEELIGLAKYGADAAFIREMRAMGFSDLSPEELVRLSRYGVDAELVRAMRDSGLLEANRRQADSAVTENGVTAPEEPALDEER
jgi:hypothetical protein